MPCLSSSRKAVLSAVYCAALLLAVMWLSGAAVPAQQSAAQAAGASYQDSMKYLQDALKDQTVSFNVREENPSNGKKIRVMKIREELTQMSFDADSCHIGWHFKFLMDGKVTQDLPNAGVLLRDVKSVQIVSMEKIFDQVMAVQGHPGAHSEIDPPLFVVQVVRPQASNEFVFEGQEAANEVAQALVDVATFCRGGTKPTLALLNTAPPTALDAVKPLSEQEMNVIEAGQTVCQGEPQEPDALRLPRCRAYPGTDHLPNDQVAVITLKGLVIVSLDGKPASVCGKARGGLPIHKDRIWCHPSGSMELLPGSHLVGFRPDRGADNGPHSMTMDVEAGKTYRAAIVRSLVGSKHERNENAFYFQWSVKIE